MQLRFFIMMVLTTSLCSANPWAGHAFYNALLQPIEMPDNKAAIVLGGMHGAQVFGNAERAFHYAATHILTNRRGSRLYLSENFDRGQTAANPQRASNIVKRQTGAIVGDVRGLENSVVRYEWARTFAPDIMDRLEQGRPVQKYEMESYRASLFVRSFFMAEEIIAVQKTEPKKNIVVSLGLGHFDKVLTQRLHESGIPVSLATTEMTWTLGDAEPFHRMMEEMRIEFSRRLRFSVQEALIADLIEKSEAIVNDPEAHSYVRSDIELEPEQREALFQQRKSDAKEVLQKCSECLCFMDRVGVR